ncbi:hypothetical protein AWB75_03167 [Caballeronia catudaia]|uniref:Uncharacterized protein n=1 Tax=Caballeronia catudaia TaxID=1777136 RepID=A0A158B9R5_9BURK|nr:hypothetical protein [Caballeronia catudaia]SAK66832.1 hypothetical protein AWB75_03167 [Caballeronia catudaia]
MKRTKTERNATDSPSEKLMTDEQSERQAFGIWHGHEKSGMEYQDELRSEWPTDPITR